MLTLRDMIPPLTARAADGRVVRAWDYKQKKSLLVVFLHADCPSCTGYVGQLAARASDLKEFDAAALVVFSQPLPMNLSAPSPIELVSDMSGHALRDYLGEEAFAPAGPARVAAFAADRYGEVHAQWHASEADGLPEVSQLLKWLLRFQIACEECGYPQTEMM